MPLTPTTGISGSITHPSDLVNDTTPQLGGFLDANGNYIQMQTGGDITSASPLVIDTDGDSFDVSGTTNFAALTVAADRHFFTQFDAILTMTHGGSLVLPGAANITTAAGDVAEWISTAANTVRCVNYTKANGTAVVLGFNLVDDTTPQLGGSLDGQDNTVSKVNLKDTSEITNAITTNAGATTIDITAGNSVTDTIGIATTYTFSNPTASDEMCAFTLTLTNGAAYVVTWPSSVDWPSATAPTLTASGVDVLTFFTVDGGTIWHGMIASTNSS